MKNRVKKSLSVFLSIVMMMSCFSMLFSTIASAATLEEAKENFRLALDAISDADKASYTYSSSGVSGAVSLIIKDNSTTGSIYNAAVAFGELLNTSGFLTISTDHTDKEGTNHWWSMIYKNLIEEAGFAKHADIIMLLTNMKVVGGSNGTGGTGGLRTDAFTTDFSAKGTTSRTAANVTATVTRTEMAALRAYDNYSSLPASVGVTYQYGKTGTVLNNSTTVGCTTTNAYYLSFNTSDSIAEMVTATSSAQIANLNAYYNYFIVSGILNTNPYVLDIADLDLLIADNAAALAKVSSFTNADLQKFFGADYTAATAFISECTTAKDVVAYLPDIDYFQDAADGFIEMVNAQEYDKTDRDALTATWTEAQVHYSRLYGASANLKAALVNLYGLDMDAIEAARAIFKYDLDYVVLRELKAEIDALYDQYFLADATDILDYDEYSYTVSVMLKDAFKGYVNILAGYDARVIGDVFGDTSYISDFYTVMCYVVTYQEYDAIAFDHYSYFNAILYGDHTDTSSADLIALLNDAEARISTLDADLAAANLDLTADHASALYDALVVTADDAIDFLYKVLAARLNAQVDIALELYGGQEFGEITLANFTDVKRLIGMIETSIYERLKNSGYLDATMKANYEFAIKDLLVAYDAFIAGGGLLNFKQTELDSQYPTRVARATDAARVEGEDYTVTEEGLLTTIEALDKILSVESIFALLGIDGGLATFVSSLITDNVFSDDIVSTLVSFLYPAVFSEFGNVFSDLPDQADAGDYGMAAVTYSKSMKEVVSDAGWYIYPEQLAAQINKTDFAQPVSILSKLTVTSSNSRDPIFRDSSIWDGIKDEDGNYLLDWGIDSLTDPAAKEARFRYALAEALKGLTPLLLGIVAGTASIGNQSAKMAVAKVCSGAVSCDVYLDLDMQSNAGYSKTLVPLFELLGVPQEKILTSAQMQALGTTAKSTKNLQPVINAILDPILYFVDMLVANPLDTVLGLLPNLAYGLVMEQTEPLLHGLDVKLGYDAYVQGTAVSGYLSAIADAIVLDIPGIVGFADLGLDLSSFNGILAMLGLDLPLLNTGLVATLGELQTGLSSKRAGAPNYTTVTHPNNTKKTVTYITSWGTATRNYIEADKADVFYYLLDYILGALRDNPDLLDSFLSEGTELPAAVTDIIANITGDTGDAIAAIVELFAPAETKYASRTINWQLVDEETGLPVAADPDLYSVKYGQYWTKEKATEVSENLPTYIDNLLKLLGVGSEVDGKMEYTLDAVVNGLLGDTLYKGSILDSLVTLITDTIASLGMDEKTLAALSKDLGIDLLFWNQYIDYEWEFEDGDKDGFIDAIVELLSPAFPLLNYILTGEDDFVAFNGGITLPSYAGYANGIVPILEALVDPSIVLTPEEYIAAIEEDPAAVITAILDPIFTLIDDLLADPLDVLVEKIANIFYFVLSDGLTVSVNNLAQAVLVLIDVIRPVYDLPIDIDLSLSAGFSLDKLVASLIGFVNDAAGVEFEMPFLYGSNEALLSIGQVVGFTSANGLQAYKMEVNEVDLITVILTQILDFVVYQDNIQELVSLLLGENLITEASASALVSILYAVNEYIYPGADFDHVDFALGIIYEIFVGSGYIIDEANGLIKDINTIWDAFTRMFTESSSDLLREFGETLKGFLDDNLEGIFDGDGLASKGLIAFFKNLFQKIIDFFTKLFGG